MHPCRNFTESPNLPHQTSNPQTHDIRHALAFVAMADQDEDVSHLRAPDPADYDPTEEAQDFLKLDKLTYAFFTCPRTTLLQHG
jgi:hypothetical protein